MSVCKGAMPKAKPMPFRLWASCIAGAHHGQRRLVSTTSKASGRRRYQDAQSLLAGSQLVAAKASSRMLPASPNAPPPHGRSAPAVARRSRMSRNATPPCAPPPGGGPALLRAATRFAEERQPPMRVASGSGGTLAYTLHDIGWEIEVCHGACSCFPAQQVYLRWSCGGCCRGGYCRPQIRRSLNKRAANARTEPRMVLNLFFSSIPLPKAGVGTQPGLRWTTSGSRSNDAGRINA